MISKKRRSIIKPKRKSKDRSEYTLVMRSKRGGIVRLRFKQKHFKLIRKVFLHGRTRKESDFKLKTELQKWTRKHLK
jgi:hypothetical protein